MIRSRKDLQEYIRTDMRAYGRGRKRPRLFHDEAWCFQLALRHHEYHHNQSGLYHKLMEKVWSLIHHHYGLLLGWDIPVNTFGPGLRINHYGLLVVNGNARIGRFCDIHQGVNIGQHGDRPDDVPTIGDNVWIGPGAKLFGRITIADEIAIGANAVVGKSFTQPGITIAGNPAEKVGDRGNRYVRE